MQTPPCIKTRSVALFLVLCGILAHTATRVVAHGVICTPRQRGAYTSRKCPTNLDEPRNAVVDSCAHCLSGGRVDTVATHLPPFGWRAYSPLRRRRSLTRAGLCGDVYGGDEHMIGGRYMPYAQVPITGVYEEGGVVDFMSEISTNHNGYYEFHLCSLDACNKSDIHASCFRNGACHKLVRVAHPDCESADVNTTFSCGPVDRRNPSRWYLPCRMPADAGSHYVGGAEGTMRYKLPDGVTCKHCVIQWYWVTAHSCNPPGMKSYYRRYNMPFGTTCNVASNRPGGISPTKDNCRGDRIPEEFWSCSDVQITTDGQSDGIVPAVPLAVEDRQD